MRVRVMKFEVGEWHYHVSNGTLALLFILISLAPVDFIHVNCICMWYSGTNGR